MSIVTVSGQLHHDWSLEKERLNTVNNVQVPSVPTAWNLGKKMEACQIDKRSANAAKIVNLFLNAFAETSLIFQ